MDLREDEAAAVLEAALALIDDYYSAADGDDVSVDRALVGPRERRRVHCHEQLALLQASVQELRDLLSASQRSTRLEKAWSWAHVAVNQFALRVEALRENARLHRAVRRQSTEAWRSMEFLSGLPRLPSMRSGCRVDFLSHRTLRDLSIHARLSARLDEAVMLTACFGLGSQSVGALIRDRVAHVDPLGTGMTVRTLHSNSYPFQLSLVADVVWRQLIQDLCGRGAGHELFGELFVRQIHALENLEARSACALRRVFTPDGSVVFAVATISTPLGSHNSNVIAGLEVHETSCWRLRRLTTPNRVCSELITDIDVKVVGGRSLHQLKRLEEFGANMERALKNSGRQRVENALVDESVKRSRRASNMSTE